VYDAATRRRRAHARRAHAPRSATAPQGQRRRGRTAEPRRAAPRRTTARAARLHAPHARHQSLLVRVPVRPSPSSAAPALSALSIRRSCSWLRPPSHRGRIPRSKAPKPRNPPPTSFFAAEPAVLAAVRFYSRPQAAGCLVGCSADVENIGSWRRAANANKVM
jgi:hypothetical protein